MSNENAPIPGNGRRTNDYLENIFDGMYRPPSRGTILVVDDEPFVRKMFRRHLEGEGFEVAEAHCGLELFEILQLQEVDVVLLDIMMPGRTGLECLADLKRDRQDIPVIMVTAVDNIDTGIEAMKAGAFDYIVKPVKRNRFMTTIENAFREKDRRKDLRLLKPFTVNHALLLNRSGIVMYHRVFNPLIKIDEDIFGGMFTAIKMFINESFRIEGSLKNIEQGDYNILIEEGMGYYFAIIGEGNDSSSIRKKMKRTVERIDHSFGMIISRWRGDMSEFDGIDKEFEDLLFNDFKSNN